MAKQAPERIWLDAVDCCRERLGSGSYYEGQPSIASVVYIREDLATCTLGERAIIDAAIKWYKDDGSQFAVPEQRLWHAVEATLTAKEKTK